MRIPPSALPHLLLAALASLSISHRASAASASPPRRTGGLRRSQQRRALNPGKRPNGHEEEREKERKEKFDKLLAEMEEIESEIQELEEDEFSEDDPDEISSSWEDKEIGGEKEEDEADGVLEEPKEMTTGKTKTTLDRDDEDENQVAVGELNYQPPDGGGGEEDEGSELDELEDEEQNAAAQLLDVEGYDLPSRPSSEGQNPDEDEDAALETEEADEGETVADGPGGAPPNKPAGPRSVPHDLPAVEHFHVSAHQVLDGDMRTEKETTHYKWSLGKPKGP